MDPFEVIHPNKNTLPILISIPHCGTLIPDNLKEDYNPGLIQFIDDTDWHVDRLYSFATELGITIIKSVFSRWVIDLNRSTNDQPLYNDGRIITGLVPTTNFKGEALYKATVPDKKEIENRILNYHKPYHDALSDILNAMQQKSDHVLLWEAHSIRQSVPTIFKGVLPDLNLGDNNGNSADKSLIQCVDHHFRSTDYSYHHNHPFKGGFITRNFGNPTNGIHALQLEMTKINYMNDGETIYDEVRAKTMQNVLKTTFSLLIPAIKAL